MFVLRIAYSVMLPKYAIRNTLYAASHSTKMKRTQPLLQPFREEERDVVICKIVVVVAAKLEA